jgi:putative flippase GtrA
MHIIRHPCSERYTLHAAGIVIFLVIAMLLQQANARIDEKTATVVAMIAALIVWYLADFWTTRHRGLTMRYEWSPRRNRLHVYVYQQWKTLVSVRLDVADYYGQESLMSILEIKQAIIAELAPVADALEKAEEIHFVGFDEEDTGIFMRMIRQVMQDVKAA